MIVNAMMAALAVGKRLNIDRHFLYSRFLPLSPEEKWNIVEWAEGREELKGRAVDVIAEAAVDWELEER